MDVKQNAPQKAKVTKERKKKVYYIAPLVLLAVVIALVEFIVVAFDISRTVLPAPHAIFSHMVRNFERDILSHMLFTLRVILTGYFVAIPLGMLIAAISSQFNILIKAITPLNILLVVTPMITLVPLLMLWMGFDARVRIIVVILQATPIIAINTLTGFSRTEAMKLELMRSMGASRLQTFFKVVFPNALPQVFTGLKLGCIFSTIAAKVRLHFFYYRSNERGFSGRKRGAWVPNSNVLGSYYDRDGIWHYFNCRIDWHNTISVGSFN